MKAALTFILVVATVTGGFAGGIQESKQVKLGKKVVQSVLEYRYGGSAKPTFTKADAKVFSISEEKVEGSGTVNTGKGRRNFTFSVKVRLSNGNIRDVNIDVNE